MADQKQNNQTDSRKFTIIKRIAKHGSQSIIVIPKMLEAMLPPGTITQLNIEILQNSGLKLNSGENKNERMD